MARRWRLKWWERVLYSGEDALRWLLQLLFLPFALLRRIWNGTTRLLTSARPRMPRHGVFGLLRAYIRWPFLELVRLFRWMGHMAYLFWPRANYKLLLQGLPSVAVAILVLLPLGGKGGADYRGSYEHAAVKAMEQENYEAADVYFRALSEIDPHNAAYRFQLAKAAEQLGDHARASALVDTLASRDATGYPPGHLWQAQRLLQNPTGPDSINQAEAHLLRALEAKGVGVQAHTLLGQIYMLKRQLDLAAEHFNAAAEYRPELYITLAKVRMLQNNPQQARVDAEKALNYFALKEEKNLDDHDARLHLAEAMLVLQKFPQSIEMLQKGMKLTSDPRYPKALSRVYMTWYEIAKRATGPSALNDQQKAALLRGALHHDPENRSLLHQLTLSMKKNGADVPVIREVLGMMQATGERPDVVNVLLAIDAEQRGLTQSANSYLTRAYAADPKSVVLLSDLARSFVEAPPHDPEIAEQVTEMGLRMWPDNPNLRYVRGYLLARRGQWLDALNDLLVASAAMPNDTLLNRLIAQAYARLGRRELAQDYFRRSQNVRATTVNMQDPGTVP